MLKKAFSLIELSIAIIVISVVITGILSVVGVNKNNSNIKITNDRIKVINRALGEFVRVNKRLPCPASIKAIKITDATYGAEGTAAGTCTAGTGVYLSTATGATKMVYGMVPTKTLGLSSDYGEDNFGNKIAYIVDKDYTSSTTFSTASTVIIGQKYVNGALTTDVANAIYALVSYGANQSGAFSAKTSNQNAASSDADEMYNDAISFNDAAKTANFSQILVKSTERSTVFDDIVYYRNRDDFLKDNDAGNIVNGNITSSANITSTPICTTTGGGSTDTLTVPGTTIHKFTSNGTLSCSYSKTATILVVGGGGSGGVHPQANSGTGGGGGGGVILIPSVTLSSSGTPYNITVGATASGKTTEQNNCNVGQGSSGNQSIFSGGGYTVTAKGGGGGGGACAAQGGAGGSGGGGHSNGPGGSADAGSVSGITGYTLFANSGGGGGGGSGGGGATTSGSSNGGNGGNGGQGYTSNISGVSVVYGSGGGGQGSVGGNGGTNAGSGASAASPSSRTNLDAVPNTGGGGGANSVLNVRSGDGASGIVIISY